MMIADNNHEKILIVSSRQCCYNSASFFADALAKRFAVMGIEVEYCRLWDDAFPEDEADEREGSTDSLLVDPQAVEYLSTFIDKSYLAIIDFNSRLPRLMMDDGTYYLDHIDAPFYDYILDNPLYHHKSLKSKIARYNVIIIDANHADYVRRYYPHIHSVMVQTLGADDIPHIPFEEKEKCVLISGSYKRPGIYRNIIEQNPTVLGPMMLQMSEEILSDGDMTIERSFRTLLEKCGYDDPTRTDPQFADQMHDLCVLENYLRFCYREALLDMLISHHVPVKLCGTGWYKYPLHDLSGVTIEMPVEYGESYAGIARSMILADVSPFFKRGLHDRVPLGFSAGTVLLSDYNPLLGNLGDALMTYSYEDMMGEELAQKKCEEIRELMGDKNRYVDMTEKAYEIYRKNYTWEIVAGNIYINFKKNKNRG